jgi:hypothetical protein
MGKTLILEKKIMKTLFTFSFIFMLFTNLESQIIVKTSETGLNLRTEPTTSSEVIYSIPNETDLLYANDWSEGWIKVRYSNLYAFDKDESQEDIDAIGWVNASYVESNMFKSSILQPMSWEQQTDGCFWGIYSVGGLLGLENFNPQSTESSFKVKVNGSFQTLKVIDSNPTYFKWENTTLKIEFFGATTDRGIESSESKGMLRVEYNGKVEYIYAALGGGC